MVASFLVVGKKIMEDHPLIEKGDFSVCDLFSYRLPQYEHRLASLPCYLTYFRKMLLCQSADVKYDQQLAGTSPEAKTAGRRVEILLLEKADATINDHQNLADSCTKT